MLVRARTSCGMFCSLVMFFTWLQPCLTVNRLRTSSTYEFRVIARSADGGCSLPSPVSDVVQLRPSTKSGGVHGVPSKPLPPEYVDFEGGDRVTLCWFPAASSLPIEVCLLKLL